MSVYLIGTLDTKGHEVAFVRALLDRYGVDTLVVDAGSLGEPAVPADVSREEVFAAGGVDLNDIRTEGDRGRAITIAAAGVAELIRGAHNDGRVSGVIGLGGSAGTTIATAGMRVLPLGLPKIMVSTMASGQCRPYVGGKDIMMLNSVVDIAGINRISREVLGAAARAMTGLITVPRRFVVADDRPLIAATMFGVTTPCVLRAQEKLEEAGYEVLVFHATGNGGEAMEGLIADGLIAGVLDITTTELADELVGGILSAGASRLTAAAAHGVPQVISAGATDMVNFGPPETVPERFADRQFYHHNPTVTLMRTTNDECARIGNDIGTKAATATGPTAILLPDGGVSAIDAPDQPFQSIESRTALFDAIEASAGDVPVTRLNHHINDPEFADAAVNMLLKLIGNSAHEESAS